MDFPIWVKQAFADGETDAPFSELADFVGDAIEAMDDPGLRWTVLFMEPQDVCGATHVVDDERFMVLLGKQDMFFKKLELKVDGLFVKAVDAGLTDGGNFVFFQKGFQYD